VDKPLTSNGSVKIQSVLSIDFCLTLFKLANCKVSTHQKSIGASILMVENEFFPTLGDRCRRFFS